MIPTPESWFWLVMREWLFVFTWVVRFTPILNLLYSVLVDTGFPKSQFINTITFTRQHVRLGVLHLRKSSWSCAPRRQSQIWYKPVWIQASSVTETTAFTAWCWLAAVYYCFPVDHTTNQCIAINRKKARDWNLTLVKRKYCSGNWQGEKLIVCENHT